MFIESEIASSLNLPKKLRTNKSIVLKSLLRFSASKRDVNDHLFESSTIKLFKKFLQKRGRKTFNKVAVNP